MARDYLYQLVDEHGLCPKYTGLEKTKSTCYRGNDCEICSGSLSVDQYNQKVASIGRIEDKKDLLILGRGRESSEQAAVFVKEGEYRGFTYFNTETIADLKDVVNEIQPFNSNSDTKRIIRQFLEGGVTKQYRVVEL
jgi:DNA polymerase-3 subunit epsilon